ncbi:MAG: type II toxin-antitoxin system VapC family toxin, partial [Candidatus Methanomethylicia archaeon]
LERNMILEDERNYMDSAFKIAVESKLTVYDSLYIALAQSIHKPLLSLDEKQRAVAQKYDVEVLP